MLETEQVTIACDGHDLATRVRNAVSKSIDASEQESTDRAFLIDLADLARQVQDIAAFNRESGLQDSVNEFCGGLAYLTQLASAYKYSLRRNVKGEHSVAEIMGIQPPTVYSRISALELKPKDFWDPDLSVRDLVAKSCLGEKVVQFTNKLQEFQSRRAPSFQVSRRPQPR